MLFPQEKTFKMYLNINYTVFWKVDGILAVYEVTKSEHFQNLFFCFL